MNLSIGQIIASNYIKYDRMTEMVDSAFVGSSATKINLFIDMNSCVRTMYSHMFSIASLDESTAIASHFINMISHYRRFFERRYNVECRAHLVYSSNINSNNQIFYPNYNIKMKDNVRLHKEKYDILLYNLEVLDKLCPYLPDVCLTMGTFETSVIMHDIINTVREDNIPNIVVSRDIYSTQLVSVNPDTMIFRPKKYKQQDESYFVSPGGCISNLISDRKVNADPSGIDDGLLSFIMALSRLPERDVKSLISLPKAISIVRDVVSTGVIMNGYNTDVSGIYELFNDKDKATCIHGGIDARFKAIDILYQHAIYSNSPERYNFKGIQNLYDPTSLHRICMDYFKVNPLDLENL